MSKQHKKFDSRLEHIPANIVSRIGQIDTLQGRWIGGAELSPQVLGNLERSVLITSTGASTRIEGAKLSDEDVQKLMKGLSLQKFADRDKQEVKGYYELLKNVFDAWKKIAFNENTIKHFHRELLKYTDKDKTHSGEYKKKENKVHMVNSAGESIGILFDTTPAYLTSKEMQELVEWTKEALIEKRYHTLLIISNFLVEFLKIHPFEDGNGRISRILTNLLLLQSGYEYMPFISHEKLVENNKPEYYIALRQSQNTFGTKKETVVPWLDFFLSLFLEQSRMAVDLLSKENIEKLLTKKQLAVWKYVQKEVGATPRGIAKNTGVAYETVRQALRKLMQLKKIERIGQGRSTGYKKL